MARIEFPRLGRIHTVCHNGEIPFGVWITIVNYRNFYLKKKKNYETEKRSNAMESKQKRIKSSNI